MSAICVENSLRLRSESKISSQYLHKNYQKNTVKILKIEDEDLVLFPKI